MITRLYVDNFKCMVNFEYRPTALQLLYGENGTGKSSVFEVLQRLKEFVVWGRPTTDVFPPSTLTAWDLRDDQIFELEVSGNNGTYQYDLRVEHNRSQGKNRVIKESLSYDRKPLYFFDGQDAHLFRDNHSVGPVFPLDWTKSGLSGIPERRDNTKLTWFRSRLSRVYYLDIDPRRMEDASIAESPTPSINLHNLASWYRHLTQDSPASMAPLFESLKEVIEGFVSMKLTSAGEMARILRISFRFAGKPSDESSEFTLRLSDLSTGQRCLIALFTLLHCGIAPEITLCIDEPDNFIALREIQPWLVEVQSRVELNGGQCLLISHHPELIDFLAAHHGVRFARFESGPVRVKDVDWSRADGLTPSEFIARGWEKQNG